VSNESIATAAEMVTKFTERAKEFHAIIAKIEAA